MSQFVEFFFANCHRQQYFAELIFTSRAQIHKNKLAKLMPQELILVKINSIF